MTLLGADFYCLNNTPLIKDVQKPITRKDCLNNSDLWKNNPEARITCAKVVLNARGGYFNDYVVEQDFISNYDCDSNSDCPLTQDSSAAYYYVKPFCREVLNTNERFLNDTFGDKSKWPKAHQDCHQILTDC